MLEKKHCSLTAAKISVDSALVCQMLSNAAKVLYPFSILFRAKKIIEQMSTCASKPLLNNL